MTLPKDEDTERSSASVWLAVTIIRIPAPSLHLSSSERLLALRSTPSSNICFRTSHQDNSKYGNYNPIVKDRYTYMAFVSLRRHFSYNVLLKLIETVTQFNDQCSIESQRKETEYYNLGLLSKQLQGMWFFEVSFLTWCTTKLWPDIHISIQISFINQPMHRVSLSRTNITFTFDEGCDYVYSNTL